MGRKGWVQWADTPDEWVEQTQAPNLLTWQIYFGYISVEWEAIEPHCLYLLQLML